MPTPSQISKMPNAGVPMDLCPLSPLLKDFIAHVPVETFKPTQANRCVAQLIPQLDLTMHLVSATQPTIKSETQIPFHVFKVIFAQFLKV